jgi:hypothetical protein
MDISKWDIIKEYLFKIGLALGLLSISIVLTFVVSEILICLTVPDICILEKVCR